LTVTAVRATAGWLGPGRRVEDALVLLDGGRVAFAGRSADLGVVYSGERGRETAAGQPGPPEPDVELSVDGFVMPGVVDRHVHIALSDPAAVVAGGVTAVRDLAWLPETIFSLVEASESRSFNGPLIRAVGPMLTCPGGYPTRSTWAPKGTGREVAGADEAARATGEVLDRSGIPVVKVGLNAEAGPTLGDEDLVAICDAAHAREAIVTCHAQGKGQVERALGAGVDELAHCPWTERLSDGVIEGMVRRGVRIVSTLDILSYGRDTPELRLASDNLSRFLQAGGTVVYGTDLGNGPIPAGIHSGEARHLQDAGLHAEGVLEALTFRPLALGEPSDLVVLGADPLEDLEALSDVRVVFHGGRRFR
jgi:imidazolonepropionase-like amidohydrolase